MSTAEVMTKLKEHKPERLEDLLIYCGFTLRFVNNGAFRAVYEIVGTDLVVKVPFPPEYEGGGGICVRHARYEFQAYRRIMKSKRKFKELHEFMPVFYYFNANGGIAVMPKYELLKDSEHHNERVYLNRRVADLLRIDDVDIQREDNYGLDSEGKLKITDMGCFMRGLDDAFDA